MTPQQKMALRYPCLLAEETAHPRFGRVTPTGTVVVTVNSGYE
jgi:hypothetical protein